jgi:hypothetical protein
MSERTTSLFYISFATDEGFRGATVVRAEDHAAAIEEATARGLNPGGEAAILQVPSEIEDAPDVVPLINRLVGREEMIALGGRRHGDLSPELRATVGGHAVVVCEHCNTPERS